MATKIGGGDPKATSVKRSAKPAAAKKAVRKKAFGKKTASAAKGKTSNKTGFPRTTWQDGNKLGKEINRSHLAGAQHPRIHHAKPNTGTGQTGGTTVHRPPIAMKYGVARPDPKPPPIAMRYGVVRPDPEPPRPPPIAMRYGVVRPDPDPVRPPPIAMKYGVPRPPEKPPISMKYGVPRPKH